MKDILGLAARVDRHAVSNVYGSAWRRNENYLPVRESGGAGDAGPGVPEDSPEQWL